MASWNSVSIGSGNAWQLQTIMWTSVGSSYVEFYGINRDVI